MDCLSKSARSIMVLLLLALVGCAPAATPDLPTPDAEPSPTGTDALQATPTPTPTEVPTETLVPVTATPTAAEAPSPTPEFPERRIEGGTLGDIWNLAALRYAEHADRFRLVLEMEEARTTAPYYVATLTDEAVQPFPSERDPAWGTVRIDLVVSDLYAYDYPLGDRLPIEVEDAPLVTAVTQFPTFDDALLGFSIWLKSPADFEVHELTDPVRLAVDVLCP